MNPVANFDNVAISALALFQVATLELWVDIMFTAVDVAGVGNQPLWNNHPIAILFFILVVIVCCFFVLNLFIGVTLDKVSAAALCLLMRWPRTRHWRSRCVGAARFWSKTLWLLRLPKALPARCSRPVPYPASC